jgi:hypothetical protein
MSIKEIKRFARMKEESNNVIYQTWKISSQW